MPKFVGLIVKFVVAGLIVGLGYVLCIDQARAVLPPGVMAPDEPIQRSIEPLLVYEDGAGRVMPAAWDQSCGQAVADGSFSAAWFVWADETFWLRLVS